MAKLTYWHCESWGDHPCYGVVAKTKRQAQQMRDERADKGFLDLGPVTKKTIVFADSFQLMELLTSEDGGRGYSNA